MVADPASKSTSAGASPLKINLGAGLQAAPGWINYDRSRAASVGRWRIARALLWAAWRIGLTSKSGVLPWPASTRVHDVTNGVPHADDSVDVVYSSHMLEHLPPEQAEFVLREIYRVLKPGGTLRLVLPDLGSAVQAYLRGDRSFFGQADVPIADAFMTTFYGATQVRRGIVERGIRRLMRTEDGGHQWMYDAESLRDRLEHAGFKAIHQVSRGKGRERSAAQLDSRSAHGLHFEAIKPESAHGSVA